MSSNVTSRVFTNRLAIVAKERDPGASTAVVFSSNMHGVELFFIYSALYTLPPNV